MADLNLFKNVLNNSEILLLLGPSLISFVFLMLNLLLHVLPLLSFILWLVSIIAMRQAFFVICIVGFYYIVILMMIYVCSRIRVIF